MADFSQYFKQLYYGLWFKRVKVDTLDIPEGAVEEGNLRINGNLEVKVNGSWGAVQASDITIDPVPAGGSGNVPSSGGTYNAIAAEATARSAADASLQSLITAEGQARQAGDMNNISGLNVEKLARQAGDAATITTIRDGVVTAGDTLQKLYNLIVSSFSEISVADIAARNAYNVKVGDHIFVVDDGDTRWALYKATTAGANATYVKLSDPDLLGASMNASAIKTAYESNADTNAFTNALLAKLNSIDASAIAVNTANIISVNQALVIETNNRQSADANLQGEINALRLATGTGSSSPINNITTTNTGNDYSGTIAVTLTGYVSGMIIEATINSTNTGPATLNINNLGAVGILKDSTTPVSSGDLIENKIYLLGFDGTNFQILSGSTPDLSGIAANTAAIAAESTARQAADTSLQNDISAEATARTNADTTLQSNISSEATARASVDQNLQIQINSLSTSSGGNLSGLQSEITARQNSDSVLQANIDAEASARAAGDTNTISTLRDGVVATGDTLQKLYNLVIGGFSEITVANIAARDAYNVKIGDHIFVTDDGDGRWALYKATTAGANATYVKLSDPDLLGATMSASQIKASYESNPDTNAFTNVLLAKLNAISGTNTGDQDISGIAVNAAAIVTESNNRQNADTSLQNNITAEATARANADAALQGSINTMTGNISANTTAIATETTARTNADTSLQGNITAEATARANADTTLQNNITAEATARANADTALQNADTTLQNNISAEGTTRANADINLQNQINTLSSGGAVNGLPAGGTVGQILKKSTATNYASAWASLTVADITDLGSTYISQNTQILTVRATSIGQTQNETTGITLINDTPAASGAQQYSPAIRWVGQGWKTSPAGSGAVEVRSYLAPIQGVNLGAGALQFEASIGGGSFSTIANLSTIGSLYLAGQLNCGIITSLGSISARANTFTSSVDGILLYTQNNSPSAGNVNYSPRIRFTSNAFNSTGSSTCDFIQEVRPVAGTNPITGSWYLSASIAGAAYTDILQVTNLGTLITKASIAAAAGFRIKAGVAPTAPTDGDIWQDGTNIYARINGVTKTFQLV